MVLDALISSYNCTLRYHPYVGQVFPSKQEHNGSAPACLSLRYTLSTKTEAETDIIRRQQQHLVKW
jgi:hypothetical protein